MTSAMQATEKILIDAGFRQAYTPPPKKDEAPVIAPAQARLMKLKKRQRVKPKAVRARRKAAPTEAGLTEVELLRTLRDHGIGRPSTYVGITELLLQRKYVTREAGGELRITSRGQQVCDFLTQTYPQIFALAFTAQMENELDAIAAGKRSYKAAISSLWARLQVKSVKKPTEKAAVTAGGGAL